MTERELQRKQLDRRLEAMNSNFFIQRPQPEAAKAAPHAGQASIASAGGNPD